MEHTAIRHENDIMHRGLDAKFKAIEDMFGINREDMKEIKADIKDIKARIK